MNKQINKTEMAKRYILCIVGLFFSALGVAITKKGELGVSPVSSVANVLSIKFPALTIGNWLFVWNCVLIVGQIIILRKKFQPIQLLQIPFSFMFGYFTDFGMWLFRWAATDVYILRLVDIVVGTAVVGFGISICFYANAIMNSGEAFVKAIASVTKKDFGNLKIGFDVSCVLLSIIMSLLFLSFTIQGTREGTIFSAVFTGVFIKYFNKLLKNPMERFLET